MKKNKSKKLIFSILGISFIGLTPIVAASCSAAAHPQVNVHYVSANATTNNIGKIKIRAFEGKNQKHEMIFENQNLLDDVYYAAGDLTYTSVKDNKRFDKNNKEIDQFGYLVPKKEVWTKSLSSSTKLTPIDLSILQNELIRLIGNKLNFDSTSKYANNLEILDQTKKQTVFNQKLYSSDELTKINKVSELINSLVISDGLYTYITSMTDQLIKWLAEHAFNNHSNKDFELFKGLKNEVAKEFLLALVQGVGAGKHTYKLALYNFSFDWEYVDAITGLSINKPNFGVKVNDELLVNPSLKNVLVRLKNIKLQYAWYNSSNKKAGSFMEASSNGSQLNALSSINAALSSVDKKTYAEIHDDHKPEIRNLVYEIPLKDMVVNFAPSTMRSANINQKATQTLQENFLKIKNQKTGLTETEKKRTTVYNEYYTGTLSKIHAFSILGRDLKQELKNEAKVNKKEYVEDKKLEDWQYYEHDRGLNGVYPYAFLGEKKINELKIDDFIKSRKFVEAIKASNNSRTILPVTNPENNQILSKQSYSQLAMIALENKDVNIHNLTSFKAAKNNFRKYLFNLNEIKSVNVNYSKWNEKNS